MTKLVKSLFKNIKDSIKIPHFPKKSESKHKIIVVDPLTLQKVSSNASLPSKNTFIQFKPKIVKTKVIKPKIRSSVLVKMGPCKPGFYRHNITGKCRRIKQKLTKVCPENRILKNGRCIRKPEDKIRYEKMRLEKLWNKHQFQLLKQIRENDQLKKQRKENRLIKKIQENVD